MRLVTIAACAIFVIALPTARYLSKSAARTDMAAGMAELVALKKSNANSARSHVKQALDICLLAEVRESLNDQQLKTVVADFYLTMFEMLQRKLPKDQQAAELVKWASGRMENLSPRRQEILVAVLTQIQTVDITVCVGRESVKSLRV